MRAHLGGDERVALVDLAEPVEHLGQLGRVDRLDGDLDDGARVELERSEDVRLEPEVKVTSCCHDAAAAQVVLRRYRTVSCIRRTHVLDAPQDLVSFSGTKVN